MNPRKGPLPALPVAEKKGFDTNVAPGASLKSVAESGILAESLKRSREKWLYDTFPKFASKPGHGAKNDYMGNTDWHSYHERGTCDVDMGPHTFSNILFYEYYKQGQGLPPTATAHQQLPPTNGPTQPGSQRDPHGDGSFTLTQSHTQAAPTPIIAFDFSDINSLSTITLPTDPYERREYLRQIHNAIAYDPKNAAAVHAAAAREGKTVHDVLAMLRQMMDLPQMPFELVIRFEEIPSDERWLIPQSPALLEMLPNNNAKLTLILPFDQMVKPVAQPENAEEPPSPVKRRAVPLIIRNITPSIKDTLTRWIGGEEKMNDYRSEIDALKKAKPQRLYLGHHLGSEATLLAHLKVISQQYAMKFLKQSTAPPRPSRAKKAAPKKDTPLQPAAPANSVNAIPTNPTYIYVNPSPQPIPAPALSPSASVAGPSVPPLAPPPAAVSAPNRYTSTSYLTSTNTTPYPAYPSPPPPPLPFSPSSTFILTSNYSSSPAPYAPVMSSYISTSAIYSTSTTTPYGSRGYLPPSPPMVAASHYPFAHYHPTQSPHPPRKESPQKRAPVPKYVPTVATVLQCIVCGATEVPLYLGGEYCRPCQDKRIGQIATAEARMTAELDAETAAGSRNNTRHSPYPVSRALSSSVSSKPRPRPRHSTHTSHASSSTSRFSLTTPAKFDDPSHDK